MFCTNCGEKIPDGSAICPVCNASIKIIKSPPGSDDLSSFFDQPEPAAPVQRAGIVENVSSAAKKHMFCTNCGEKIPRGSEICPLCGATIKIIKTPVGFEDAGNSAGKKNSSAEVPFAVPVSNNKTDINHASETSGKPAEINNVLAEQHPSQPAVHETPVQKRKPVGFEDFANSAVEIPVAVPVSSNDAQVNHVSETSGKSAEINNILAEQHPSQPAVHETPVQNKKPVSAQASQPKPAADKNKSNRILLGVLAIALLAGIGFLGYKLGSSKSKPAANAATAETAAAEENNKADESKTDAELDSEPEKSAEPEKTPEPQASSEPEKTERTGTVYIVANASSNRIKVRKSPGLDGTDTGERKYNGDRVTVYDEQEADGYTWYQIDKNKWIAGNGKSFGIEFDPEPEPAANQASEIEEIDVTDVEFVASEWYKIYLSYLEANNHGGDTSYLVQYRPERVKVYSEMYEKYNKGFTFENVYFDFDKTAFSITDLSSGVYEAECYAHVYNKCTEIANGKVTDNEVLVHARLQYDPTAKLWLMAQQRGATDYSYSGHEMIHFGN